MTYLLAIGIAAIIATGLLVIIFCVLDVAKKCDETDKPHLPPSGGD